MRFKNLTGSIFGKLTVLSLSERKRDSTYSCLCECGNSIVVAGSLLRTGHKPSCGCLTSFLRSQNATKHGLCAHPLYWILAGMKSRCYNTKEVAYADYGGRGIKVCDEWLASPETFIAWGLDNGWEKGLQIDREDNDGDYCPNNCRFVTPKQNSRNRRSNIVIQYQGETKTLAEWCEGLHLNPGTCHSRFKRGWSADKVLSHPIDVKRRNRKYPFHAK
jgi:hypothetical protein